MAVFSQPLNMFLLSCSFHTDMQFNCQPDYNLSLGNLLFSLEKSVICHFCSCFIFIGILKFPYVSRYGFLCIFASGDLTESSESENL